MKFIVTGATGMVGRHVVKNLIAGDHQVVAISRNHSVASQFDWFSQVQHFATDIDDFTLDCLDDTNPVDGCIHLAWGCLDNFRSIAHIESELPKAYRFIRRLVDSGISNILVTGTCLEYGIQFGPLSEETVAKPVTNYGIAKNCLHQYLQRLALETPLRLTWARLFYMFGDGQSPRSLLPLLEQAIRDGDEVFAMSGGEQLRDFLPVEHIASDLVHLAIDTPDAGTVNVCSGSPISVRRLVERHREQLASKIRLDLGRYPYPDYEPLAFWGDNTKLHQLLAKS